MKNYLNIVFGIITGILFAGALYISVRTPVGTPIQLLPSPTPDPIVVFVGGAVKRPGVYKLPYNARLVDAVQQAGGFLIDADFSQLNLAKKLADGEQIVVPGGTDISTPQLTIGGNGLLFTPT